MEGEVIPQLRDIECLDMMVDVMSEMPLHLYAADGFVRVGFKAKLMDSDLDKDRQRSWLFLA